LIDHLVMAPSEFEGFVNMDLSQSLFAAALNVSPETIRAWEQGSVRRMDRLFGCSRWRRRHPDFFLEKVRIPPAGRAKASYALVDGVWRSPVARLLWD
jgi:hypothetical protein